MKSKLLFTLFIIFFISSCKKEPKNYESETLKIKQVANNVYQHISYLETESWGSVPCNGMVYLNGNEAIIFDTPTNKKATKELINWIGKKKVKAVVATHFHIDCLATLEQFHAKGIKSYATKQTIELARANNEKVLPQNGFEKEKEFQIGNKTILAKYYGEGHTKDNIVGYVPSEKVLFGGCFIKQVKAPKGNLEDANTSAWPTSVKKLKKELTDIKVVIPGHGKSGGTELLDYTIKLFEKEKKKYVFFLHNRFLEEHDLEESHPEYGRTEYKEIIAAFEKRKLTVISEQRKGNVNAREYASRIVNQIDSLVTKGVKPEHITVVGTSKGGYIAQYVSTLANNPKLNFVFVASFQNSDLENIPEINFCGNILNIYEKTDPFGQSAIKRKQNSTCEIAHFKEIELHTGMKHGFLFKPLKEWIEPAAKWANGNYEME